MAQTAVQTVRGTVVDQDSRAPMAGAKVMILSVNPVAGAIADENGKFSIAGVPVGRHTLKTTYIGYEPNEISELVVTSGKEVVLEIALVESFVEVDEVVIRENANANAPVNELLTVSARKFSIEETQRYAAALNDPGRMASAFAGVQPSSDGRNEIVIRGNNPAGMIWRLEGIDIPNPNHFANPGSSGGGLSILSNYLLDNSDFITGAFPAEYGNGLSGVFDLHLRKGNNEKHEFSVRPSVLGIDVASEGPLSKKSGASYLVNYRYSFLGLMQLIGLPIVQGADYAYQDLSFNVSIPTEKAGKFGVFGLGGLSSQTVRAERDSTQWAFRGDRRDERYGADMGAAGLRHVYLFGNNKTWIRSVFAASVNRVLDTNDTLNAAYDPVSVSRNQFIQGRYTLTSQVNHKFNRRHLVRAGVFGHQLFYDFSGERLNYATAELERQFGSKGSTWLLQPYAQYRWRLFERLTVNAGLHGMYFGLNGSWAVEPRGGLSWNVLPKHTLSFGYGLHSQLVPLGTYFAESENAVGETVLQNHDLDFSKAHHYVLGWDYLIAPKLRLKLEAYYQDLFNVPVGTAGNPTLSALNTRWGFESDSLVNEGTGRNYGLEMTFEKFFSRNYYFLITGSLYESFYTPSDGIERDTRYNGNYALNLLGGKEIYFGKNKNHYFELSGRTIWQGGQRYTPIDLAASRLFQRTVYDESQAFTLRRKDYFRTDMRIAWHHNKTKAEHVVSVDFQNLFNSRNDLVQYYDVERDEIREFYQAGFVPVIAYKVNF